MTTRKLQTIKKQQGAALIVGLVMLLTLTLLAVSGMNTATMELTMAANNQYAQSAFQLAESGVDTALGTGGFSTLAATVVGQFAPDPAYPDDMVQSTTAFVSCTIVPPRRGMAMSLGSTFRAYHFNTTAIGNSSRNAASVNTQNFFVIGPESSTCDD